MFDLIYLWFIGNFKQINNTLLIFEILKYQTIDNFCVVISFTKICNTFEHKSCFLGGINKYFSNFFFFFLLALGQSHYAIIVN